MFKDIHFFIKHTIDTIPGFTEYEELLALYLCARSSSGNIVEIGSWCGRSAVVLAKASKHNVYCVDLFPSLEDWQQNNDSTWSISDRAYIKNFSIFDKTFRDRFLPVYQSDLSLYDIFVENTSCFSNIIPICGTVDNLPDVLVSFAFIDGNHDTDGVYQDILAIKKRLTIGGIIAIDDFHFNSVKQAVLDSNFSDIELITRKLVLCRL